MHFKSSDVSGLQKLDEQLTHVQYQSIFLPPCMAHIYNHHQCFIT